MTTALFSSSRAHLGRKRGATTVPSSRAIAVPMRRLRVVAGNATPGDTVLIVGATGGVGQLTAAKLLEKGFKVKALCRNREKAATVLGESPNLELVVGDCRDAATLKGVGSGCSSVVCVTGTTAFPSARWKDGNGPEATDYTGNVHLIDEIKRTNPDLKRFVFVSSIGVERTKQMPFLILNLFKVLQFKRMAEQYLQGTGLPYTIMRPGRLTDGPYTSYDLNTLLKATSGTKRDVQIAQGETLLPEATSRIVLAEACVQALMLACTENRAYELGTTEGAGPEDDAARWEALYSAANQ